jgi:pimeloyl-ACP methyl ester carboxylesterase
VSARPLRGAALQALLALCLAAPLFAQQRLDPEVISIRGAGPTTYVLITGLVGGLAGYRRVEALLVERGFRVVIIDPYRLAIDSANVSFDALAGYVDVLLERQGIASARVVGHAHGAGVALRLAANAPGRVSSLFLLDAGAVPSNQTRVFSRSLRLIPLITRLPGGRGFVRWHLLRGLRQHSGSTDWLDPESERAYTEPLLDHISLVIRMAERLSQAQEPEPVEDVVARTRVTVTVILAGIPHAAAPDSAQLALLAPLGQRVRMERLPGVGHFPHEEAPEIVARVIAPAAR